VHLVGFIVRIYHDAARSYECQKHNLSEVSYACFIKYNIKIYEIHHIRRSKWFSSTHMLRVCIALVRSLERGQTLLPADSQTIRCIYNCTVLCMSFRHTRRGKSVPAALFNPAIHGGEYRASRSDCSVPCTEHLGKKLE
jgi:transketolase C-terminal domain/subunit